MTTKLPRPDLAAYGIAALGILCITLLLALGHTVPDYLPLIAMTAMGAGGGMALNTPNGSETLPRSQGGPPPARRPLPAQGAPIPAPAPAPAVAP